MTTIEDFSAEIRRQYEEEKSGLRRAIRTALLEHYEATGTLPVFKDIGAANTFMECRPELRDAVRKQKLAGNEAGRIALEVAAEVWEEAKKEKSAPSKEKQ